MKEWTKDIIDLNNGSAIVIIYDERGEDTKMLAQIYVDDYDHGHAQQYISLIGDINNLPDSIDEVKAELQAWGNGWDDDSPLERGLWWEAGRL